MAGSEPALARLRGATRVLVVGIGGGGDVVGALAVGRQIERLGTPFELAGVAWERFAIDPHPGPRALDELSGIRRLPAPAAALAGAQASTPEGIRLCEGGAAAHLGREVGLVDITRGPTAAARGIEAIGAELGCDLAVLADVGGDVLADGSERGLASPLCDAVMLAAGCELDSIDPVGCVFGAGCDAELTPDEVLERIAALAAERAWLGSIGLDAEIADELLAVAELVPTEASLLAARCAHGARGPAPIRGGLRTAELGPHGALSHFFDPAAALASVAPLAAAVRGSDSIEAAREALASRGVRTELDYERERAAGGP